MATSLAVNALHQKEQERKEQLQMKQLVLDYEKRERSDAAAASAAEGSWRKGKQVLFNNSIGRDRK